MVAALAPVAAKALSSAARAIFANPGMRNAVLKNKDAILKNAGNLQKSVDKLGGMDSMANMVAFPYGMMVGKLGGNGKISGAAEIFTKVATRMA